MTTMGTPDHDAADLDYPACLLVCPDFVLGTLSLTVTDLVEEALAPLDLRLRHYQLLRLLHFDGPRLQSKIGPVLGVDRTTVVALVDQLEKLNLAKRVRSADDRRAYLIAATTKGKRLAIKATELVGKVEATMFAPLSVEEQNVVRKLSARLLSEPGILADAHTRAARR
jgi:DNA-binding MarR family transcriptional regulator